MICSERLAQLRREHDYTQEQLAELIGVSRQTISKWETGAANPDIEKLMQLSKLYNCSVDYMVGNKINSKQNEEFKPQSKKKNNIKKYGLAIIFLLILAVSVISVIRLSANDKKTNSTVDFLTDEDSEKITDNDLIIFSDKEKLEKEVGFPVDEFTYFNMENVQFKSYDRIIAILECQEILRRTVKITFYKSRDSFDIVNKYFVKAKSYIFNNQYVKINEKTVCGVDVTLRGYDTPLDMRMDREQSVTAKDIVNEYPESELFRIIKEYGEERFARSIARNICRQRKEKPIETTLELVDLIRTSMPAKARNGKSHPAKRTFQAIRIECNRELDVLRQALDDMVD